MRTRKTTRITVTTDEVWVLHKPTLTAQVWCQKCATEVRMAPAETVAAMLGISARAVYRSVESERLHYSETPDGRLFICLHSIQVVASPPPQPAAVSDSGLWQSR